MLKIEKGGEKQQYLGEIEGKKDVVIEIYIVTSCSNIQIKSNRFFDPK